MYFFFNENSALLILIIWIFQNSGFFCWGPRGKNKRKNCESLAEGERFRKKFLSVVPEYQIGYMLVNIEKLRPIDFVK